MRPITMEEVIKLVNNSRREGIREGMETRSSADSLQLACIRAALQEAVPPDGTFGLTDDVQRFRRAVARARREGAKAMREACAAECARIEEAERRCEEDAGRSETEREAHRNRSFAAGELEECCLALPLPGDEPGKETT